ncbi:bifunctional diguanylate cyclase/phosphodiesterase [Marinimicrobium sp. LS-A18]|uniref:putative bifunctional diguanylate cyclase/phosphodiesterase n=1 Tax=Marinimicrobium sp. LS-A18 TaxID=1381596 RepID=UPI00046470A8|nr:bifunctional diguanylate cyclase/phosphodiesterase [Marinimicrobium sp. LS-A18]
MRTSYLAKVLLLLLGLVLLVELSSYTATRLVVRDTVTDNARLELQRGGEVFAELIQARAEQLSLSAEVLTDDFGFKEAVAVADAPTLVSALENHAARINADIALVADQQGDLVASTQPLSEASWNYLRRYTQVQEARTQQRSLMIDGRPYQFVISDVRAPLPLGVAGLGFEIDNRLTETLKRLTGLEISFVSLEEDGARYLSGTLPGSQRQALLGWLSESSPATETVITTEQHMTLMLPVAEQPTPLAAVLQVPLEQVMAPFARLNGQLLWIALGFSIIAALLAVLLARSVTQPVSALANVARRIAGGYYDTPVPVRSRDELGELAQGFTRMQSAIAEREQQILYQARHDQLTGLINRSQLFPELESAIEKATWSEQRFTLMVLDIDNFTRVNDALSPEMGDRVLAEVGRRLLDQAGPDDRVARLGSDEFALMLWQVGEDEVQTRAEALLEGFADNIQLDDLHLGVDINLGVVLYPDDGDQPETLLRRANLALNQGRLEQQRITRYETGWDESHLRRLALFGEFRQALEDSQLDVYYQPKLWLDDSGTLGAEALVRWRHPEMGMINPEEFVAVAESTGQIGLLTRWVLRRAITQAANWSVPAHLSVNLSALDLLDDDLPDFVVGLLSETELPAERLCLEITESAIMREADKSLHNLERLRAQGISLSIDDFGTGYSSLSQLKKLPVSELKIDKSFILNLDQSEDDQLIVRSTIDLGHTLGLTITAEGVENQAIEKLLVALGCDRVQGFYYSKPLPHQDFLDWLSGAERLEVNA